MHSLIAAIILCNALLFFTVATVSSQPQPLSPVPRHRPRGGGHHGPRQGHHYPPQARNPNGRTTPQNRISTPIPNQNQNPNPNENQNPPQSRLDQNQNQNQNPPLLSSNQNQNQNQNQNPPIPTTNQNQNQNQNQNSTTPPQIKGGGNGNQGQENRKNPGKLFGWAPNNGTTSSDNRALLADEFLHAHNWVRSKYNLPPYTWDEKLEIFARKYLMKRYNDCKMVHSKASYGENLFWGKKLHWTPSDAVYFWYMEKDSFDFKTLKCSPPPTRNNAPKTCGHFTQVVWRDSLRLGCALQHCNNRSAGMLIACEYDPPGNYDNENPLEQHS